jgi:hypothetical protein
LYITTIAIINIVIFLKFNNSGSGPTKIHTGEHDVDRVAEYLEWKGYKLVPFLYYSNLILFIP